jgi:anti-sigma factor RsiW
VQSLLPLFFDSELDARQMRSVAVHSATCESCEGELRQLERLQEMVAETIGSQVDDVDLSGFWQTIERRIGPQRQSWRSNVRQWWETHSSGWAIGTPVLGAAVAGFLLAITLMWRPDAPQVAGTPPPNADNPITVHSIESASNVALLSEADTLVLWVDEEESGGGGSMPASLEVNE